MDRYFEPQELAANIERGGESSHWRTLIEMTFCPRCGHSSRVKCCDLNRRPLCELRLQHPECEANGSNGLSTFPMLPFARDFAKYTNCALLPLVWRMAKVGYPPTLSMVQRMLRQTSRTALG